MLNLSAHKEKEMKTIAWAYIGFYIIDAILSIVSSFSTRLEIVSDTYSSFNILFTCIVFIFACFNKVQPRRIFFIMTGYYFLLILFGFVLGIVIGVQWGPDAVKEMNVSSLTFLRTHFNWYWPVHWMLLLIWSCVALYGFIHYKKHSNTGPTPASDVNKDA